MPLVVVWWCGGGVVGLLGSDNIGDDGENHIRAVTLTTLKPY